MPPQVAFVSPVAGATNVSTSTTIGATFSEIVTSVSVSLTDPSGKIVKGTMTCGAPCVTVTFAPATKLKAKTTYAVGVSGMNSAGTAQKRWTFTTRK